MLRALVSWQKKVASHSKCTSSIWLMKSRQILNHYASVTLSFITCSLFTNVGFDQEFVTHRLLYFKRMQTNGASLHTFRFLQVRFRVGCKLKGWGKMKWKSKMRGMEQGVINGAWCLLPVDMNMRCDDFTVKDAVCHHLQCWVQHHVLAASVF